MLPTYSFPRKLVCYCIYMFPLFCYNMDCKWNQPFWHESGTRPRHLWIIRPKAVVQFLPTFADKTILKKLRSQNVWACILVFVYVINASAEIGNAEYQLYNLLFKSRNMVYKMSNDKHDKRTWYYFCNVQKLKLDLNFPPTSDFIEESWKWRILYNVSTCVLCSFYTKNNFHHFFKLLW
jgi:hypothetical protein